MSIYHQDKLIALPSIIPDTMLATALVCILLSNTLAEMLNSPNCGVNYKLEGLVQDGLSPYIIGGGVAGPGLWPWACSVGFLTNSWEHQCGGALGTLSKY